MAVTRVVSIGFGSKHEMVQWLEQLHHEAVVDQSGQVAAQVEGNGEGAPRLALVLTNENDPEWPEPIVDYSEKIG